MSNEWFLEPLNFSQKWLIQALVIFCDCRLSYYVMERQLMVNSALTQVPVS